MLVLCKQTLHVFFLYRKRNTHKDRQRCWGYSNITRQQHTQHLHTHYTAPAPSATAHVNSTCNICIHRVSPHSNSTRNICIHRVSPYSNSTRQQHTSTAHATSAYTGSANTATAHVNSTCNICIHRVSQYSNSTCRQHLLIQDSPYRNTATTHAKSTYFLRDFSWKIMVFTSRFLLYK